MRLIFWAILYVIGLFCFIFNSDRYNIRLLLRWLKAKDLFNKTVLTQIKYFLSLTLFFSVRGKHSTWVTWKWVGWEVCALRNSPWIYTQFRCGHKSLNMCRKLCCLIQEQIITPNLFARLLYSKRSKATDLPKVLQREDGCMQVLTRHVYLNYTHKIAPQSKLVFFFLLAKMYILPEMASIYLLLFFLDKRYDDI